MYTNNCTKEFYQFSWQENELSVSVIAKNIRQNFIFPSASIFLSIFEHLHFKSFKHLWLIRQFPFLFQFKHFTLG